MICGKIYQFFTATEEIYVPERRGALPPKLKLIVVKALPSLPPPVPLVILPVGIFCLENFPLKH